MLVLDALVRSALVLILHDTADQLVILLQEPLDGLLVDLSLAAKPVRGEDDRHAASKLGIPSRKQHRR